MVVSLRRTVGLGLLCAGCLSVPPATESEGVGSDTTTTSTATTVTSTSADTVGPTSTTTPPVTTTSGGATGSTGGDSGVVDIEGERIEVPEGWTGGVWFDFSDVFVFDPAAYPDDSVVFNNAPHDLFVLRSPFDSGLGVVTVHTILELGLNDAFNEHYFFRATGATGPDALSQVVDCRGLVGVNNRYCVGAGSQGAGDGLFTIADDWSMELLATVNNVNALGFDPTGSVLQDNEPRLLYSTADALVAHPDALFLFEPGQPRRLTDDGRLAVIIEQETTARLALLEPGTQTVTSLRTESLPETPIARQNGGALSIVTGTTTALPGVLYVVVQGSQLWAYSEQDEPTLLAQSDPSQGFRWASAVVPESPHPLARQGQPTFYILEGNRASDIDRVIWLQPP